MVPYEIYYVRYDLYTIDRVSLVAQMVKNPPAMWETLGSMG